MSVSFSSKLIYIYKKNLGFDEKLNEVPDEWSVGQTLLASLGSLDSDHLLRNEQSLV